MGAARYVGRLGGLAVALGIGTAVLAGQGLAWAQDSDSPPSGNGTQTSGTTGPAKPDRPSFRQKLPSLSDIGRHATSDPQASKPVIKQQDSISSVIESAVAKLPSRPGVRGAADRLDTTGRARTVVLSSAGTGRHAAPDPEDPVVDHAVSATPSRASGISAPLNRLDDTVQTATDTTMSIFLTPSKSWTRFSSVGTMRISASASVLSAPTNLVNVVLRDLVDPLAGSSPTTPPMGAVSPLLLLAAARREEPTGTGLTTSASTTSIVSAASPGSSGIAYDPEIGVVNGVITGVNPTGNAGATYTVIDDPSGGGKVLVDKTTGNFTYLPYSAGLDTNGSQQFGDPETFTVLVSQTTAFDTELESLPVVGALVKPILLRLYQVPILSDALSPIIGSAKVVTVTVDDAALAAEAPGPIAFTTTVVSFDSTPISVNYFPADEVGSGAVKIDPTILNGPSLATAGYTDPNQDATVFGLVPGLSELRSAGYNVVTWDPRGEFASGGVLQLDSPDYEAKDVSAIISWVSLQPETQFDSGTTRVVGEASSPDNLSVNNPLIGMVGGSYGGGIQLTSAGIDHRIDVIAPGIAWNNLQTALYPNDAFKTSWASLLLLSLVVSGSRINPTIYSGIATGALLGFLTPKQLDFLNGVSPSNVVGDITAPTLLLQGTVDGLFPLQESVLNAEAVEGNGTEVKMIWYCGGHGQCLDPVNLNEQTGFLTGETIDWMNVYLKDDGDPAKQAADEAAIPNFQWVDQDGTLWSSKDQPLPDSGLYTDSAPIVVEDTNDHKLTIVPIVGGSGPQNLATFPVSLATAAKATNAINIPVAYTDSDDDPETPTYIVGQPTVTMTYSGVGTSKAVYVQLVDDQTGRVVGNIATPVEVDLDGKTNTVTVPMEDIAYTMNPGDTLTLQIVGSATQYEDLSSYGTINVSDVTVSLPTANPADVQNEGSFASDDGQAPVGSGSLLGI